MSVHYLWVMSQWVNELVQNFNQTIKEAKISESAL